MLPSSSSSSLTSCLWLCSRAAHLWCFAALCPSTVLGRNVPVLNLSAALSYLLRALCFAGCCSQALAAVSPNTAFASLLCGKAKRGHTAASATIGVSVCGLLGESDGNNHFWSLALLPEIAPPLKSSNFFHQGDNAQRDFR